MLLQFIDAVLIRTLIKMALGKTRLKQGGNQGQVLGKYGERCCKVTSENLKTALANRRQHG